MAFGIPYFEQKVMLDECLRLEDNFRELLRLGENKKAYDVYITLGQAQDKLTDFVMSYKVVRDE